MTGAAHEHAIIAALDAAGVQTVADTPTRAKGRRCGCLTAGRARQTDPAWIADYRAT